HGELHDRCRGPAGSDPLQDIETVQARHVHVEDREIGSLAIEGLEGRRTILGLDDQVAGLAQGEGDETEELQVVVDHEDLHRSAPAGRITHMRVPAAPSRSRAATRPPCLSTIDYTMNNPRPMPLSRGSSPGERMNRSNRRSPASGGRPGPSSSTHRTRSASRTSPPMPMVEPAGANLLALARRLTRTCTSRGASPLTAGSGYGRSTLSF